MRGCCSLDFVLIGINKVFGLSKQMELALKLSFHFIALFTGISYQSERPVKLLASFLIQIALNPSQFPVAPKML